MTSFEPPALSPSTMHTRAMRAAILQIPARPWYSDNLPITTPVTLRFDDGTEFSVTREPDIARQRHALKPLMARCSPAPFGKGNKTVVDKSVREALQLDVRTSPFTVVDFERTLDQILGTVQTMLCPHVEQSIVAELYNVNLYARGGHFKKHKDTPRGADCLGTLVVCLPTRFTGGPLVLEHGSVTQRLDWADNMTDDIAEGRLSWAAFFGDVDHSIERVSRGVRSTITWLLRLSDKSVEATELARKPSTVRFKRALESALADSRFLPRGGTIGFPCFHLYQHDLRLRRQRTRLSLPLAARLKGRDACVALEALEHGLDVTLCPYMADDVLNLWSLREFPTAEDIADFEEEVSITRFGTMFGFVSESEESVVWVGMPERNDRYSRWSTDDDAMGVRMAESDAPALDHVHSCAYSDSGYFGNEATYTELYVLAALHVTIPPWSTWRAK